MFFRLTQMNFGYRKAYLSHPVRMLQAQLSKHLLKTLQWILKSLFSEKKVLFAGTEWEPIEKD